MKSRRAIALFSFALLFALLGVWRKAVAWQFMSAVSSQDVGAMRFWLRWGASPNTRNARGMSALEEALWARMKPRLKGNLRPVDEKKTFEAVRILTEAGAELRSSRLFRLSLIRAQDEIALYLLSRGMPIPKEDFDLPVALCDVSLLRRMINEGADVNGYFAGETPLLILSQAGRRLEDAKRLEAARILLESGADPNKGTEQPKLQGLDFGVTPLMRGHFGGAAFMKLLLEHGALVDAQSRQGGTALYFAVRDQEHPGDYLWAAEMLLAHGADPNKRCVRRETPCELARKRFWRDPKAAQAFRGLLGRVSVAQ